jgi:hypothetical protein
LDPAIGKVTVDPIPITPRPIGRRVDDRRGLIVTDHGPVIGPRREQFAEKKDAADDPAGD